MALAEATPEDLAARRRPGLRRRARPAPHPRPRHPARALRRRRRGRPAPVAGLPAAVGLRPRHPQAGRAPGAAAVDLLGHHPSIASGAATTSRWRSRTTPRCGATEGAPPHGPQGRRRPGAADLEQDGARPLGEARLREGRRHPTRDRPLRRAPPPAPARRHRQPPLLRLVPRRRARPPRLPPGRPAHGPLRHEFGAQAVPADADVLRARALARPRLGAPRPHPRLQKAVFDRYVPPADHATFESWRTATQEYQAAWCAGRSRRCGASSTGRPAASPSSASPTATRR